MYTQFISTSLPIVTKTSQILTYPKNSPILFSQSAIVILRHLPGNLLYSSLTSKLSVIGLISFATFVWKKNGELEKQSDPNFKDKVQSLITEKGFNHYFGLENVAKDGNCFYHSIAKQVNGKNAQQLRQDAAAGLREKFQDKFTQSLKRENAGDATQLLLEMQESEVIKESDELITQDQFNTYVNEKVATVCKDVKDTTQWASDFHAAILAEKLDAEIHIVSKKTSGLDLSYLLSFFFIQPEGKVSETYSRVVHGQGKQTKIYLYHADNHYQVLKINNGYNIDQIPQSV